jgi:hypothetical protein
MLSINQSDIENHRKSQCQISFFNFYKLVGKLTVSKNCKTSIIEYFGKSAITPHTVLASK